jgi:isopentenyl-diphosphate delta-isomerase
MSEQKKELIEALDKNARPTGKRKTWLNIINDGDWRGVVHVWIINSSGELLVQQRAAKGAWDGLWDVSLGGTISAGETPEQAAVRELAEELGLTVGHNDLRKLGTWNVRKNIPEKDQESKEFSHDFLLRRDLDTEKLSLQKEEVSQVAWRSLNDMKDVIRDDNLYKSWVPHPKEYYSEIISLIEEQL